MPAAKSTTSSKDETLEDKNNTPAEGVADQTDQTDQVDTEQIAKLADKVLAGEFGDWTVVRQNLTDAKVDVKAVLTKVNDRLERGAPTAYKPGSDYVLDSVQRGEWGDHESKHLRVQAAGFHSSVVRQVETGNYGVKNVEELKQP